MNFGKVIAIALLGVSLLFAGAESVEAGVDNGGRTSRTRNCGKQSLLSIFNFGSITTGSTGDTFPILYRGYCPISAGMIRVRESEKSPFGPLNF